MTARRRLLAGAASLAALAQIAAPVLAPRVALATPLRLRLDLPEKTVEAAYAITGGAEPSFEAVALDIPTLAENGRSVPMKFSVGSPMTDADHVRVVHILAGRNPITTVARFHFTPDSGEAFVSTRIRLADSQKVVALAQTSTGRFLIGEKQVIVTLGGCLDPVL